MNKNAKLAPLYIYIYIYSLFFFSNFRGGCCPPQAKVWLRPWFRVLVVVVVVLHWIGICWNLLRTLMLNILTFWCGGKWILLDIESFLKLHVMCWLFLSLQLHLSLLLVRGCVFWIFSIVHYLLIQLKFLFVPRIGWRMQRIKDQ